MKAWLMDAYTGVDHLRLADVPGPAPAAGQVVLDVEFAGLNPADRYLSEGQYPAKPPLPHILGRDGVGTVSALGPDVKDFKLGERLVVLRGEVGVSRAGTFAQRVAAPVESLARMPRNWTVPQAAGAPLVYLTAYQALTQWGDLPRSVVLVTGASGGVGVASIQLGKAMGHDVIALSRSADKRQKLIDLGAAACFDPTDPDWRKKLKGHLAPRRVDLAIDNIGGSLLPEVIDTLGDKGKISLVGRLAGVVPQFNTATLFFRRLKMGGVHVGGFAPSESQLAWTHILELLDTTGARPIVDQVFAFDQLRPAFNRLEQGPMGKVLLQVKAAP